MLAKKIFVLFFSLEIFLLSQFVSSDNGDLKGGGGDDNCRDLVLKANAISDQIDIIEKNANFKSEMSKLIPDFDFRIFSKIGKDLKCLPQEELDQREITYFAEQKLIVLGKEYEGYTQFEKARLALHTILIFMELENPMAFVFSDLIIEFFRLHLKKSFYWLVSSQSAFELSKGVYTFGEVLSFQNEVLLAPEDVAEKQAISAVCRYFGFQNGLSWEINSAPINLPYQGCVEIDKMGHPASVRISGKLPSHLENVCSLKRRISAVTCAE